MSFTITGPVASNPQIESLLKGYNVNKVISLDESNNPSVTWEVTDFDKDLVQKIGDLEQEIVKPTSEDSTRYRRRMLETMFDHNKDILEQIQMYMREHDIPYNIRDKTIMVTDHEWLEINTIMDNIAKQNDAIEENARRIREAQRKQDEGNERKLKDACLTELFKNGITHLSDSQWQTIKAKVTKGENIVQLCNQLGERLRLEELTKKCEEIFENFHVDMTDEIREEVKAKVEAGGDAISVCTVVAQRKAETKFKRCEQIFQQRNVDIRELSPEETNMVLEVLRTSTTINDVELQCGKIADDVAFRLNRSLEDDDDTHQPRNKTAVRAAEAVAEAERVARRIKAEAERVDRMKAKQAERAEIQRLQDLRDEQENAEVDRHNTTQPQALTLAEEMAMVTAINDALDMELGERGSGASVLRQAVDDPRLDSQTKQDLLSQTTRTVFMRSGANAQALEEIAELTVTGAGDEDPELAAAFVKALKQALEEDSDNPTAEENRQIATLLFEQMARMTNNPTTQNMLKNILEWLKNFLSYVSSMLRNATGRVGNWLWANEAYYGNYGNYGNEVYYANQQQEQQQQRRKSPYPGQFMLQQRRKSPYPGQVMLQQRRKSPYPGQFMLQQRRKSPYPGQFMLQQRRKSPYPGQVMLQQRRKSPYPGQVMLQQRRKSPYPGQL